MFSESYYQDKTLHIQCDIQDDPHGSQFLIQLERQYGIKSTDILCMAQLPDYTQMMHVQLQGLLLKQDYVLWQSVNHSCIYSLCPQSLKSLSAYHKRE